MSEPRSVKIRVQGRPIDEIVADLSHWLDARMDDALLAREDLLRAHGATEDEVVSDRTTELERWVGEKAKILAGVPGWISRGGEPLQ